VHETEANELLVLIGRGIFFIGIFLGGRHATPIRAHSGGNAKPWQHKPLQHDPDNKKNNQSDYIHIYSCDFQ